MHTKEPKVKIATDGGADSDRKMKAFIGSSPDTMEKRYGQLLILKR